MKAMDRSEVRVGFGRQAFLPVPKQVRTMHPQIPRQYFTLPLLRYSISHWWWVPVPVSNATLYNIKYQTEWEGNSAIIGQNHLLACIYCFFRHLYCLGKFLSIHLLSLVGSLGLPIIS